MIITTKQGRKKSILTPEEIDDRAGEVISALTPEEKELLFSLLGDTPEEQVSIKDTMLDHRYHTEPVSMEQFLEDPYYLGGSCGNLYPALKDDLIELFSYPYREFVSCLHPDTVIPLMAGGHATMAELIDRWDNNEEPIWIYSVNKDGDIVPAEAHNPRYTGEDDYLKVALDDGTSFTANPRHQMVMRDNHKKMVMHMKPGDSIMPFEADGRHIISIEKVGHGQVCCMTVPDHGNFAILTRRDDDGFTRNGVFSSNTGAIGVGKCIEGNTEIIQGVTGERKTIKQMCEGNSSDKCATFDKDAGEVINGDCTATQSGMKLIGELELSSGKKLGLTPDHPVLTPLGYKKVSELNHGDLVATARSTPEPEQPYQINDSEVKWIGYMLADGGCTAKPMTFTKACDVILGEFKGVTYGLGGRIGAEYNKGEATTLNVLDMDRLRGKYELYSLSKDKRIPGKLYGLDNRQLALLINRIWSCDGWLCKRSGGKHWELGIALASEKFVHDIQQLLLRFGIHSRVRERDVTYTHNGEKKKSKAWSLNVLGRDEILSFLDAIGDLVGRKEDCATVRRELEFVKGNTNVDVTPMNVEMMKIIRKEIGPIPKKAWWNRPVKLMGHKTMKKMASLYDLPDWCKWWTDVFWDRVESYKVGSELEPVYDMTVPGTQNFSAHGVIIHNTFGASIAICRIIYELSCLVNPQDTFGLSKSTELAIALISMNLPLARRVMKSAVDDKIKESPYFMEKFAPKFSMDNTIFPHNIRLTVASYRSERVIGLTIISAFLDETNFPPKNKKQQITTAMGQKKTKAHFDPVEKMYRSMVRRIESRFLNTTGEFPMLVVLASSAATLDSFTERKIKDSENKDHVFIRDHTPWTVKPADRFSGEKFWVLCSTSSMRARILEEDEYDLVTDEYLDDNDAWLIDIPIDFKEDFEMDIENAMRDIAGISTQAISAFIQRTEAVDECIDETIPHAFSMGEWTSGGPGKFRWDKLCRQFERRIEGGFMETAYAPIVNPGAMRWCHIDTSISGDATGFCVGHIEKMVEVPRRDGNGRRYYETAPSYYIDVMMRINPPRGEAIYMPDIRTLLYSLQAYGYRFAGMSSDAYMYIELHQQVKRRGIAPHLVSVDRTTEPYDELKRAIYEGRIRYNKYEPFIEEVKQLEYDRLKGKIDHPEAGSKDVADACAGTVFALYSNSSSLPMGFNSGTNNKGTHKDAWVSPFIPADQLDVGEAREMAEAAADDIDCYTIISGD